MREYIPYAILQQINSYNVCTRNAENHKKPTHKSLEKSILLSFFDYKGENFMMNNEVVNLYQ